MNTKLPSKPLKTWREALLVYTRPRVIGMIFLGFSAGLPFLLVFSTLSAWLRDEGTSRTVIGFFSWVGVTYSVKVFWAPIIDRLPIPILTHWLGKRRSWMLLAQLGIALGLAGMAVLNTDTQLNQLALLAVLVAFSSSTQDIVIDAYRIEAVDRASQGAMAATYVFGYRLALLVAGAGAFYIAEFNSWEIAYLSMAALMGVGVLTTLIIREPEHIADNRINTLKGPFSFRLRQWFASSVVEPFVEFFSRNGKIALPILLLIAIYKLSDITMGVMANPFYLDLGFSKTDIANISKIFGFFMTIGGAALGGILVARYGIMRPLLLGAIMVALTNVMFALLAISEPSLTLLALVISTDNLSGGLAASAFIAYLSSLTNQAYTATQYALFSSLMTLPAKLLGGFSGIMVDTHGYFLFFIYAAAIGLPAIILVTVLITLNASNHPQN
jgi:PAT family beta-lactamase induction signal transducer AmpG